MRRSVIETVLGAVVLLVALVFLALAYSSTNLRPAGGYSVTGKFYAVDGLSVGADVRIAGVKVGAVTRQSIDSEMFQAVVEMSINPEVRLPEDSLASISSAGLLGGSYVKIEPGVSDTLLGNGDEFNNTKDIVALEELLGKVIFLVTDEDVQ